MVVQVSESQEPRADEEEARRRYERESLGSPG